LGKVSFAPRQAATTGVGGDPGRARRAHAGAHLDKFDRAPRADLRLQVVHLFVVAAFAVVAGGSLARRARDR
jgi:hypothetical protein